MSSLSEMEVDDPQNPDPEMPNYLHLSSQTLSVEVSKDRQQARYTGDGGRHATVVALQSNVCAPSAQLCYYYECLIVDRGLASKIGIGFTPGSSFRTTNQPGWDVGSYGYHGDDGKKYSGSASKGDDYGPIFGTGDTIGAGIMWQRQEVFFTKNGNKLRTAFRNVKGILFPTIGLQSKNECVRVNFGQKPFVFDLQGHIEDEQATHHETVNKLSMPLSVSHDVVRRYLLHYGYAGTLHAFDRDAGLVPCTVTPPAPVPSSSAEASVTLPCSSDPICNMDRNGGSSVAVNGDVDMQGDNSSDNTQRIGVGSSCSFSNGCSNVSSSRECLAARQASDDELTALSLRHNVRQRICDGDMEGALLAIQASPLELLADPSKQLELQLHLYSQTFIELVRRGDIKQALAYAQKMLAPLRPNLPEHLVHTLNNVIPLIAYESPETCPLQHLLLPQQREAVADAANSAILVAAASAVVAKQSGGEGDEVLHDVLTGMPSLQEGMLVSSLQAVLQHVSTVHDCLHLESGGYGEVFCLQKALLPAEQLSLFSV